MIRRQKCAVYSCNRILWFKCYVRTPATKSPAERRGLFFCFEDKIDGYGGGEYRESERKEGKQRNQRPIISPGFGVSHLFKAETGTCKEKYHSKCANYTYCNSEISCYYFLVLFSAKRTPIATFGNFFSAFFTKHIYFSFSLFFDRIYYRRTHPQSVLPRSAYNTAHLARNEKRRSVANQTSRMF